MSNPEPTEWVVRLRVTEDQRKAIKVLAVERDQELADLLTAAVETSPLTKKVFA